MKKKLCVLSLILALAFLWSCSKKNPSSPGGGGGSGGGGGGGGGTAGVTVVSPNGGESWLAGSKHTITWTAIGLSTGQFEVLSSKNGGQSWEAVSPGLPLTTRSYAWSPEDTTHQGLVLVQYTSGSQVLASDSSDHVFTVTKTSNIPYVVGTISADAGPYGVAATPDGNYAYVTCSGAGRVDVIATANDSVVAKIAVGNQPQGIVISGGYAYVANYGTNSISVISTTTQSLVNTIYSIPGGPSGIAASGHYLFTMSSAGTQLVVYDLNSTNFFTRNMPSYGYGVAVSGAQVYATSFAANAVTEMDTVSFVTTPHSLPTGQGPYGIALRPGGGELYVADALSNHVSALSLPGFTETAVPLSGSPTGVAVNLTGTYAYASQNNASSISAVNTSSKAVTGPVAVGSGPLGLAITPGGKHVYVANYGANTVSVVYTNGY
jgi:YVTN family beta-propeller protein